MKVSRTMFIQAPTLASQPTSTASGAQLTNTTSTQPTPERWRTFATHSLMRGYMKALCSVFRNISDCIPFMLK